MWRYEPATGNWTWMSGTNRDSSNGNYETKCISDTGLESSGRFENRARWKDACGNFWFYGGLAGYDNDSSYNDLWYFNPVSLKWTFVNGSSISDVLPHYGTRGVAASGNTPGCLGGAVAWCSKAGALYLFGGLSAIYDYRYNYLWMYTIDTSCGDIHAGDFIVQVDSGLTTCGQSTGTITVKASAGNGPYTYHWNNGSSSDTLQNLPNGTYAVTVTDRLGCSVSASSVVDSSSEGDINVTASNSNICSNDSAQICAPPGFATYTWSNGDTTTCFYTNLAGNYYVTVTDNHHCTAQSIPIALSVFPVLPVAIAISGDTLRVYNGVSYQWYSNNQLLPGDTSRILITRQPGSYMVAVVDSNGCSATSNAFIISGISSVESTFISVFPNPQASTGWTLVLPDNMVGSHITIYDDNGRIVFEATIISNRTLINPVLTQGIYLLNINSAGACFERKLVKL